VPIFVTLLCFIGADAVSKGTNGIVYRLDGHVTPTVVIKPEHSSSNLDVVYQTLDATAVRAVHTALQASKVGATGESQNHPVGGSSDIQDALSGSVQNTIGAIQSGSNSLQADRIDFRVGEGIYIAHAGSPVRLKDVLRADVHAVCTANCSEVYTYAVAAIDTPGLQRIVGGGITAASIAEPQRNNAILSLINYNTVTWTSDSQAVGYALYRNGRLLWRVQNILSWRPGRPVQRGSVIVPMPPNGHMYICTQDGLTGTRTPTEWPTQTKEPVRDGTTAWSEDGVPSVSVKDDGSFPYEYYATPGANPYDPNIPKTPPPGPLADALVTKIVGINGGGRLLLSQTAETTATAIDVTHDDTSALQNLISNGQSANAPPEWGALGKRRIELPPGNFNISMPLVIGYAPSSGQPKPLQIIGCCGESQSSKLLNTPFGHPLSYSLFNPRVKGGNQGVNGSVIRTLLPIDGLRDENAVTRPEIYGPASVDIRAVTLVGYGLGQTTGVLIGSIDPHSGGAKLAIGQWNRLSPTVLNFDKCISGVMQWSTIDSPLLVACNIAIDLEPGNANDSNQILNAQIQAAQKMGSVGILAIDGSGLEIINGNIELADYGIIMDNMWVSYALMPTIEEYQATAANVVLIIADPTDPTGLRPKGNVLWDINAWVGNDPGRNATIEIRGGDTSTVYMPHTIGAHDPVILIDKNTDATTINTTDIQQVTDRGTGTLIETNDHGVARFSKAVAAPEQQFSPVYSATGNPVPQCNERLVHFRLCVSDARVCSNGMPYIGSARAACLLYCDGTRWLETGGGC